MSSLQAPLRSAATIHKSLAPSDQRRSHMGRPDKPQQSPVPDFVDHKTPYELERDRRVSELAKIVRPLEEAVEAL
jgi:hypothetical protein